ncbi:integrase, catalytic region, zinc finger, CCHC-type containing protein [Tanacetum coccineum]
MWILLQGIRMNNQTGQFGNQRVVNVVGARETVGGPVVQQSGIQCFNCKEFGHYAKECRKSKREVPNADQKNDYDAWNRNVIDLAQKLSEQTKFIVQLILFIVDSGCTKHMTGNLSLLCNFVEKYLGTVHFGNDQFAPILGYGDLFKEISRSTGALVHYLELYAFFKEEGIEHQTSTPRTPEQNGVVEKMEKPHFVREEGIDSMNHFAPVVLARAVRSLSHMPAQKSFPNFQMDVKTAFLKWTSDLPPIPAEIADLAEALILAKHFWRNTVLGDKASPLDVKTQLHDYGFNYNKDTLYCDFSQPIAISCTQCSTPIPRYPYSYHFIKRNRLKNG